MPGETPAMNISETQQTQITALLQRAQHAGVELRSLPSQPLTCCGRGCNGCVWEGYFTALDHWCEDAAARGLNSCTGLCAELPDQTDQTDQTV